MVVNNFFYTGRTVDSTPFYTCVLPLSNADRTCFHAVCKRGWNRLRTDLWKREMERALFCSYSPYPPLLLQLEARVYIHYCNFFDHAHMVHDMPQENRRCYRGHSRRSGRNCRGCSVPDWMYDLEEVGTRSSERGRKQNKNNKPPRHYGRSSINPIF